MKVKDIVKLANQNKMPAVALTDMSNLCGALEFSNEAAKNKIQPIIGVDLNIEIYLDNTKEYKTSNILLLCQNENGYKNLLLLIKTYYEKQLEKKELDIEDLSRYSDGLIALSGFKKGILTTAMHDNHEALLKKLTNIFDSNRFYIEIQRHGEEQEREIEEYLLKLAYNHDIPIVATNDALFGKKTSHPAHEVATCIKDSTYISDHTRRVANEECYFKNQKEMEEIFSDLPEGILNTEIIAKRCYFKVENRPPTLPKYSDDETSELIEQSRNGLFKKFKDGLIIIDGKVNAEFTENADGYESIPSDHTYKKRLEYELDVINNMGFAGYFLIVGDFINWSKSNDIPVGPGRGSAAGSLVAWCLGITDVDPIRFGLLFERFLNPERVSMPDIDVDFCQEKRDLVINYIQKKYGIDHVAHIITFGALQARAVLRDVGRVLGMPYSQVDNICKLIPFNPANPITLAEAIELDPQLQQEAKENETVNKLLNIGLELEGILRNQSTHAAGIVISDKPLHEIIPVCRDLSSGALVSQFHMKPLENAGLVKFDFLGLTTLTLLNKLYKLIKKRHGIEIDFEKIETNLDDKETYSVLATGDAIGVFQLESGIMRDGLKKIHADSFEDIVALTSLNRPGPMENLPDYVARKFGRKEIDYLHPSLKNLLHETFGIIVYQEQVMEIARILAGYSLGAADILRRAMGKKIQSEMDAQKEIFIDGAIKNGLVRDQADYIFELVNKFAGYGFNKSHATAYSLISYYTAWLKVHYKLEFLTVLMNLEIHDTDKLVILKNDAEQSKIKVLPPHINFSEVEFSIDGKSIRYGISACKGAGKALADEIIKNRNCNGKFRSIGDFLNRFDNKVVNKKFLEAMIKSGAFDCFHTNRAELLASVEDMILFKNKSHNDDSQQSLFSSSEIEFVIEKKLPEWTAQERMRHEFEAIGFYLTENPISYYSSFLETRNITYSHELKDITQRTEIAMVGVITYIRIRSSKRGKFANITLSDQYGLYELFMYDGDLIQSQGYMLKEGTILFCKVKVNVDKETGALRLLITEFSSLLELIKQEKAVFEIEVNDNLNCEKLKESLGEPNAEGQTNYFIYYFFEGYRIDMKIEDKYDFPLDLQKIRNLDGVKYLRRVI
jgi:DNA polymerase-3 subunit alpha